MSAKFPGGEQGLFQPEVYYTRGCKFASGSRFILHMIMAIRIDIKARKYEQLVPQLSELNKLGHLRCFHGQKVWQGNMEPFRSDTVTENGWKLEISDLSRRGIILSE